MDTTATDNTGAHPDHFTHDPSVIGAAVSIIVAVRR